MNKTGIEWVKHDDGTKGFTWNPVVGCEHGCEYCYARELAQTRFAAMPGKCKKCGTFEPHFHKDACTKIGYTPEEMIERNLRQIPWVKK